jgi:hypothetical protein
MGSYNAFKRLGAGVRSPEMKQIKARRQADKLKRELEYTLPEDAAESAAPKDEPKKEAGWKSEIAGMLNPINLVAGYPGMALAATTPTRTLDEQAAADEEILPNLFVPGRNVYNMYKRMGATTRSPEMLALQAKAKQRKMQQLMAAAGQSPESGEPVETTKTSARGDASMRAEYFNNLRVSTRPDYDHGKTTAHTAEDYEGKGAFRRAGPDASDIRKKTVSRAARTAKELHERDKKYRAKSANAFDFGAKQAGFVDDTMAQNIGRLSGQFNGGLAGVAGGGALGALYGAYDPGAKAVLDENGQPVLKRRSRLMSALRGGLQGGLLGGLAGNVAGGALGGYMARPAAPVKTAAPQNGQSPLSLKAATAFNFGVKMAEGNPAMPFTREGYNQVGASSLGGSVGLLGGGAAGAGLGALHGLISPGEVVGRDENGQPIVKKRNRLMGALRGGLAGGAGGALGGMALGMGGGALTEKYRPGTLAQLMPAAQKSLTDTYDRLSTAK